MCVGRGGGHLHKVVYVGIVLVHASLKEVEQLAQPLPFGLARSIRYVHTAHAQIQLFACIGHRWVVRVRLCKGAVPSVVGDQRPDAVVETTLNDHRRLPSTPSGWRVGLPDDLRRERERYNLKKNPQLSQYFGIKC